MTAAHDLSPTGCPISRRAADFDPFGDAYQYDPAGSLRWSRDEEPVFYSPELGYWVVTRYEDVKAVFRDNILFSPAIALEKITPAPPEAGEILKRYGYALNRTMVNEDEPDHRERRRLLMDAFLPERLAVRAPMIRQLTRDYVDRFIDNGRADLVKELFWEVPQIVALKFLGVDEEDIAELKAFSVAHTVNTWGRPSPEEQLHVAESVGKFWVASGKVLEKMRANPDGEGWMYDSIRKNAENPEIVTDSYLHSMMMAILVAAHETTAKASANAFHTLLSHPERWAEIVANPRLIPNAVEECLRYAGSAIAWRRIATAETEVGGVAIPKGGKLLIVQASANHDERHFENADALDLYRDNTTDHLTFGYGAHQCMGKNIGRMEMRIFVEEIARRIPHIRLTEQKLDYLRNTSFWGPESLWVEWDPANNPERADPALRTRAMEFPVGPPNKTEIMRRVRVAAADRDGDILYLTLEDPMGRPLPDWTPGSHVDLIHQGVSRKYSLCGVADGRYQLAILCEAEGRGGSRHFFDQMAAGAEAHIAGPRNLFRMAEDAADYVLIAGGIGITPILAMADRLNALGRRYRLHYAGRSRADMALLDRVTAHGDAARLHVKDEGTRMDLAAVLADLPAGAQVYACGPERMLEALEAMGLPGLRVERFTSGAAELDPEKEHGFDLRLADSDTTVRVQPHQTVLEALTLAGIDVDCDCREGLCGSCEALVLDGEIDHRDKVLSAAEHAKGDRMMTCCSRAKGGRLTLAL